MWERKGRLLGIADLLDPVAGVVGEFDGADHRTARRHTRDIAREEGFRRVRLEVFRVTGMDLGDPARVVSRMAFHRSRASWPTAGTTSWTIRPPRGWRPEQNLDEHLTDQELLRTMRHETPRDVPPHVLRPWTA